MIQQISISPMSCESRRTAAMLPVILAVWIPSYLAIDLIMWAAGRSTLISNIVISLPMMLSAPVLTMGLERLQRRVAHLAPAGIAAILLPAAFGAAIVQGAVDYWSVRTAAALLFPDWQAHVPTEHRQFGFGIYVYALHFLCCLLAMTLVHAHKSAKIAVRRHSEAVSAHRRAEAKALRLQLNPHFLFNALNSIAALVGTGGNKVADAMICRLSDFMRASIADDPCADVSLSGELATAESYLAIEQLRFGDRLITDFTVSPDAWDAAIPGFILQPLAENAVKHGLNLARSIVRVSIQVERRHELLLITVTNKRTTGASAGPERQIAGTGTGLSNIRQRLALVGSDRARLETEQLADGFRAKLSLPYRRFANARGTAK